MNVEYLLSVSTDIAHYSRVSMGMTLFICFLVRKLLVKFYHGCDWLICVAIYMTTIYVWIVNPCLYFHRHNELFICLHAHDKFVTVSMYLNSYLCFSLFVTG
jgi:hypothetical protein